MSRSLLHDWECAIDRCCRDDNPKEMISIAEDIYNTAYARGKNHSNELGEVLNKIRAEIANHCGVNTDYCDSCRFCTDSIEVREILKIIDKYKAETEET